jgi:outer membrane protein assembly factor BamE (lipoprotein component of BamABCDE complex)
MTAVAKMRSTFTALLLATSLAACDTPVTQQSLDKLSPGMTKQQVIAELGVPIRTSAQKEFEYLFYKPANGVGESAGRVNDFLVRLKNGKVESFGQVGDFDD